MKSAKPILAFVSVVIFAVLPLNEAFSDEVEAFFVKGTEFYQNGNYSDAIDEFRKIVDSGYESWEVYFNLGNAYFKNKQTAEAIINFERAKRLNPKDEDIEYNLELANLAIVDRIQELPQFFVSRWISNLSSLFSLNLLGWIAIGLYFVLIGLIIGRLFAKSGRLNKINFVSIVVVALTFGVFAGLLSTRIIENETKVEAIVTQEKIVVRSAPVDTGTEVFTLHEGVKVEIQDRSNSWLRIRLADGKRGWLQASSVEVI
ncbi:MAG: tetratricopeptide repeat protein [bacterium]